MISRLKHGRFFNHLFGSNLILLIIIIFYNLLTYFIPLIKISITQIIFSLSNNRSVLDYL